MDISTNVVIKWKNIKTDISICDDNTIVIDFDDKATNNHFIGQLVYGTVESTYRSNLYILQDRINIFTTFINQNLRINK